MGGGYSDLYADELSNNQTILQSIYDALKHGLPCIAEGSGFSYLHQTMSNEQGNPKTMVGIFSEHIQTAKRLQNFGYFMLTANEEYSFIKPRGSNFQSTNFIISTAAMTVMHALL